MVEDASDPLLMLLMLVINEHFICFKKQSEINKSYCKLICMLYNLHKCSIFIINELLKQPVRPENDLR